MSRDTFERLAPGQLERLYRYARRLVRDPEQAADLVQDTFERALRYRNRVRSEADLRPLLFRILQNLYVDRWRVRSRHELPLFEPPEDLPGPEVVHEALSDEVERALMELHDSWRATLWLRDVEGFSYDEIAEITGTAVGTVRSRLSRARRQMAERLAEYARARALLSEEVRV
ncbi:MAG: sigma-70 family RNA polymerase sigma factor [Candidatus Eremiobacterota bacterium]